MSHKDEDEELESSDIAVIGMSGRFPGARNVSEFWKNICDGVESVEVYTDEELLALGVEPALLKNPNYVKAGAAVDEIELFDAAFFGYSPREAEVMDHQHRLFLEASWEALESAGYNTETYPGSIGVFAGVKNPSTYLLFNILQNRQVHESTDHMQLIFGNSGDYAMTNVSYKLNLRGPSYVIQSACSTSLVAVHIACQNILSGECNIALAGGVSINSKHKRGYLFREGGIQSPDGHTRAFDEKAQGVVGGEGLGIVVLKGLAEALADGDHIYAVIKGSAINNDGSLKMGFTAPSIEGQARAIAEAHAMAGFDPASISYVEAHGTGTVLGDPVEIAALTKAFRARTDRKQFCAIGSVKTNIGHLDTAAGVTGLIKTVMSLDQKKLPPSLFFEKPNPKIDFASSPFFVNTRLTEWERSVGPLRAGVSSFGVGGTNAHVVLEEAPTREPSSPSRPVQLLVLSAKTETALDAATANLLAHLKQHTAADFADVAYTLQVGRRAFTHRLALACTQDDAVYALETLDAKRIMTGAHEGAGRPLVMMFAGQGTQYVNMTRGIYESERVFKKYVDQCAELLNKHLARDVREVLYPSQETEAQAAELLKQTSFAQPALFVVEYALASMLMKWGLQPQSLIGHSIGEYVAACLSGVMSLEDALALVAARGRLMQGLPEGAMLAVHLAEEDARELLSEDISLAAVNAPSLCVISGPVKAVTEAERQLLGRGVGCRRLHTSHAFHSRMMEPILDKFASLVRKINLKAPQIPYVSNVTGDWITAREATDPEYWTNHLRGTVRFADGVNTLLKDGPRVLLEIGPGQALHTFASQCAGQGNGHAFVRTIPHQQEENSDAAFLMQALGHLWIEGQKIIWEKLYAGERRYRLPLPTYPFERQRYWIELPTPSSNNHASRTSLEKNADLAEWFYVPSWKRSQPLLQELPLHDEEEAKHTWLVFADECGLGEKLARRLAESVRRAVIVRQGDGFNKTSEREFVINPASPLDYEKLLAELHDSGLTPTRIMHLWNVESEGHKHFETSQLDQSQRAGFLSLLYLTQALSQHNPAGPIGICVVSNNLHEVTGEESLCPEKATILGFCKVIPKEFAQIFCRAIDILLPLEGTRDESRLVRQLIAEFDRISPEQVVAYRGQHRWVQTYEKIRLDERLAETRRLRENGVYLITGGLGGVGLALAEYLAREHRAKLVLIGREGLPPEHEWENWLAAHEALNRTSARIRKILELREAGAEVLVVEADVSSLESMSAALAVSEERFGQIRGVIHAAGVAGGGLAQLKTREMVREVFAPKITGALVLHQLFEKRELDFMFLCSSINAVTGGIGQIDYCAANAFLDAFAHFQNGRRETFVTSVNFPAWQETGMAFEASMRPGFEDLLKHDLSRGMLTGEAIEVCKRILSCSADIPQVVVSTQHLPSLLEQHLRRRIAGESVQASQTTLSPAPKLKTYTRPNLKNEYTAPGNKTERAIVDFWQEIIGVDRIGINDNFFDLGGHSLMAVQLLSRLRDKFQVELPLRSFFDSPTVAELAQLIARERGEKISSETITAPSIARHSHSLDELLSELDEEAEDSLEIS